MNPPSAAPAPAPAPASPPARAWWTSAPGLIVIGLLVIATLGTVWGLLQGRQPPLKVGGRLIYQVTESMKTHKTSYTVNVSLVTKATGQLELKIADTHGERSFPVKEDLQPLSAYDVLDIPLSIGEGLPVDSFWLTDTERKQIIQLGSQIKPWHDWRVQSVPSSINGNRLYEVDTGLLVGFEAKRSHLTIQGRLLAIR